MRDGIAGPLESPTESFHAWWLAILLPAPWLVFSFPGCQTGCLVVVDADIHNLGKLFTAGPSHTDYMEQWVECFVGIEHVIGVWLVDLLVPYAAPVTNGTHPAHADVRG